MPRVNALATPTIVANALVQPKAFDPFDFSDQYNTRLTPQEEQAFQLWAKKNNRLRDVYDYDLRGFWKSGGAFADNGHGADTYKKPNHPTFSDQSQYHDPENMPGGVWQQTEDGRISFTPSPYNLKNMSPRALKDYFLKFEPGVMLNLPE